MDDYLPKPLNPQQLHTKLQALLPTQPTAVEPTNSWENSIRNCRYARLFRNSTNYTATMKKATASF